MAGLQDQSQNSTDTKNMLDLSGKLFQSSKHARNNVHKPVSENLTTYCIKF